MKLQVAGLVTFLLELGLLACLVNGSVEPCPAPLPSVSVTVPQTCPDRSSVVLPDETRVFMDGRVCEQRGSSSCTPGLGNYDANAGTLEIHKIVGQPPERRLIATLDTRKSLTYYPNGWIRLKDGKARFKHYPPDYDCPGFGRCMIVHDPKKLLIILEPNGDYKIIEDGNGSIKAKVLYAYNPAETPEIFNPTPDELKAFGA